MNQSGVTVTLWLEFYFFSKHLFPAILRCGRIGRRDWTCAPVGGEKSPYCLGSRPAPFR